MRSIAYYWGLLGVIGVISSAVLRLGPRMLELGDYSLTGLQWTVLVLFTPYMAYAEGYKGFHQNFAPRVLARALCLREGLGKERSGALRLLLVLFAPLFCMGFFYATRRRLLVSWLVTAGIIGLVLAVSHTVQPWRGIIDTGVVTGLGLGILSLLWHWQRFALGGVRPAQAADLPGLP